MAILLSEPDKDFTGGEFVLTEQRPPMQSRADVVALRRGDGVVFAVHCLQHLLFGGGWNAHNQRDKSEEGQRRREGVERTSVRPRRLGAPREE